MSDIKPNYRTKRGVEVMAERATSGNYGVSLSPYSAAAFFTPDEFAMLFEPIPQPKMVMIGIGDALTIRDILRTIANVRIPELDSAIAAAERGEA